MYLYQMSCSKYTITNAGSTITNFNYRRCDDSMWEYQVELLSNETKNIWLINDTYSTAFIDDIIITNNIIWPPVIPTPDPDALLFFSAANITNLKIKVAINTLITNFKLGGVWDNLIAAYPLVTQYINQLTYTQDFSNSAWTKNAVTVQSVPQNTPIGTSTCYEIIPSTSTTWHYLSRGISTLLYDEVCVLSVYAKANGYDWLRLLVEDGIGGYARCWFNVNTGVIGTSGSVDLTLLDSTITEESDGFYRISIKFRGDSRALLIWISPSSEDNQFITWSGNGTSSVFVTGAQLEFDNLTPYESVESSLMATQMMYNLKNPLDTDQAHRIEWNSTLVGFSKRGFVGNTTYNNWGNINLIPATSVLQNDAHLSVTSAVDFGIQAQWIDFGLFDSSGTASSFHITPDFGNQGMRCRVNSSIPTTLQFNNTTKGIFIANRVNPTQIELYVDGDLVDTESINSTGLSSLSMYLGAINENGTATVKSLRRLTFATVGEGLTSEQALSMSNAISDFNTTLLR